jgi:hypothetical protein
MEVPIHASAAEVDREFPAVAAAVAVVAAAAVALQIAVGLDWLGTCYGSYQHMHQLHP